jgi:O-acetyl-ADP-ribose deacetylase (regulator of RNase III)
MSTTFAVHVTNVATKATEKNLRDFIGLHDLPQPLSVHINTPTKRNYTTNYAFWNFANEQDAARVAKEMNNVELYGVKLGCALVPPKKTSPPRTPSKKTLQTPKKNLNQVTIELSSPVAVSYVEKVLEPQFKIVSYKYYIESNKVELTGDGCQTVATLILNKLEDVEQLIAIIDTVDQQKIEMFLNTAFNGEYIHKTIEKNNTVVLVFIGLSSQRPILQRYLQNTIKIKSELKNENIKATILKNNDSDDEYSGSDVNDNESTSSTASELNEAQHSHKVRLFTHEHFDEYLKQRLDKALEKHPGINYEIVEHKGKQVSQRFIQVSSSMKSDVDDYVQQVYKIIPSITMKLSSTKIDAVRDKALLKKVNELKVNVIFTKEGIVLYGIGKESTDAARKQIQQYLDSISRVTKQFNLKDNISTRQKFYRKFKFNTPEFKAVKINDDKYGFSISGKGSSVTNIIGKLSKFEKEVAVKSIVATIASTYTTAYARKQIQKKLTEVEGDENEVYIFVKQPMNPQDTQVKILTASTDDELLEFIEQMVTSICQEVCSDKFNYRPSDLDKINKLDVSAFNNEWNVELSKGNNVLIIKGLKVEDLQNAKEAIQSLLSTTDPSKSQTVVKVYCRRLIRVQILARRKSDLEQIAKNYQAKVFLDRMKAYDADSILFKAPKDKADAITKDTEKLIAQVRSTLKKEEVPLVETKYFILKATNQWKNVAKQFEVEIRFPVSNYVCKSMMNNYCIGLRFGDITKYKTDAIVNPANENLQHVGGLAKIIADAAGTEFIQSCKDFINNNGTLQVGKAMIVSSGDLKNCSKIINTVGPHWSGGRSNEEQLLTSAVVNSLTEADKNGLWGVSMPAISSGIFNYPLDNCLQVITAAVFQYFETHKPQSLKACYFVHNDKKIIAAWKTTFKKIASQSKSFDYSESRVDGDDVTTMNASDSVPPQSSQYYNWYYVDDDNEWKSYIPKYNEIISKEFNDGNNQMKLTIGNKSYILDFVKETQKNVQTGYERKLQRNLPSTYNWVWLDSGVEQNYSQHILTQIEEGYQARRPHVLVNLSRMMDDVKQNYYIQYDFQNGNHVQINETTNFRREVKRYEVEFTPQSSQEQLALPVEEKSDSAPKIYYMEIHGHPDNISKANKALRDLIKKQVANRRLDMKRISRTAEAIRVLLKDMKEIEVKEDEDDDKTIVLVGLKDSLDKAELKVYKAEEKQEKCIEYPKEWTTNQKANCELTKLDPTSHEYKQIEARMRETVPQVQVIQVDRIQNRWLWKKYINQREIIDMKNSGNANEKYLFHGTRNTAPTAIYQDEVGFDMRYSQPGLWGKGCYFAQNAVYSASGYAHTSGSNKQMFLAKVAVGESIKLNQDGTIALPPVKTTGGDFASSIRYDAVNSPDGNIFIIYENSRAYPSYLITFR